MNWFLCVLGLLGVATVVCLCLHQYQATEGARGEETYVDYTPLTTEAEQVAADAQDPDLLGPTAVGNGVVAKEEQAAEAEEEEEEEEGSRYTPAAEAEAEEEEAVPTRKRTPPPAEEEATRATPSASSLGVLDVIDDLGDDLAASTATPAEEEAVTQEEERKAAAATTAKRTPPVQAVLQVIDVPPPEEEEAARVAPEAEEEEDARAPAAKAVSYQDETYAYHPSPKDVVVEVDEPGYVYLPSRFWSVPQKRPPPCTPATKPKVCPIFTDGVPEGALEWRSTVRERQLRAAVRPAHARHRRDPKLDYYYPGYYAKGDVYKHKCA